GMMADYGLSCGSVTTLTGQQIDQLSTRSTMTNLVHSSDGSDFYIKSGMKHQIYDSPSLQQAGLACTYVDLSASSVAQLPVSTPIIRNNVISISKTSGMAYLYQNDKFFSIPDDLMESAAFTDLTSKVTDNATLISIPID